MSSFVLFSLLFSSLHCDDDDNDRTAFSAEVGKARATANKMAALDALRETLGALIEEDEKLDDSFRFLTTSTLKRYLRARNGNVDKAAAMIRASVKWRKDTVANLMKNREKEAGGEFAIGKADHLSQMGCIFCEKKAGYHPMRQVGFDLGGRPIIYSVFSQANNYWFGVADAIAHLPTVLENSCLSMVGDVDSFVWVIDFTGFGLGCCNPMQGRTSIKLVLDHFPEQLGKAFMVNAPFVFSGFWAAITPLLDKRTKNKISFHRNEDKFRQAATGVIGPSLLDWLHEEIRLNKKRPIPPEQLNFWRKPSNPMTHDPRACPEFISSHIEPFLEGGVAATGGFTPHPNIASRSPPRNDSA